MWSQEPLHGALVNMNALLYEVAVPMTCKGEFAIVDQVGGNNGMGALRRLHDRSARIQRHSPVIPLVPAMGLQLPSNIILEEKRAHCKLNAVRYAKPNYWLRPFCNIGGRAYRTTTFVPCLAHGLAHYACPGQGNAPQRRLVKCAGH